MKERIRKLGRYQRIALLLTCLIALLFTAIYLTIGSREGIWYQGAFLEARQEDGGAVYAGRLIGKDARFTVSADKAVTFRYGDTTYGPYTAREDASLVSDDAPENMTGVELYCGDELLFRGEVLEQDGTLWLYNEDGTLEDSQFLTVTTDTYWEPNLAGLLSLMDGPALTHRGSWLFWGLGMLCCVLEAVFVLFTDELYRFALSFRTRSTADAEPSDWEMLRRYATWTFYPLFALFVFVQGLIRAF